MSARAALIVALALLVCLGLAQSVLATHFGGRYLGRTSQGEPLAYRAGAGAIGGLAYVVNLRCSDGDAFRDIDRGFPPIPLGLVRYRGGIVHAMGGSFLTPERAVLSQVRAVMGRSAALGRLRVRARFDPGGERSRTGSVLCDSGVVAFAALRRSA